MTCSTDLSFLLQLARDADEPLGLAEAALDLSYPDGSATDSAPAVIAAEVLDHAVRSQAATRSALAAAALTGPDGTPGWARLQIHAEGLAHVKLLHALVLHVAHHLPATPARLRLLAHVLAPPQQARR